MIIATHPGRHGDVLWALPTVRALAEAYGEPVHLRLSAKYGSEGFCALLERQLYVGSARPVADWQVEESAPIGPRVPALSLDDAPAGATVVHLGYEGWPTPTLPEDVWWRTFAEVRRSGTRGLPQLDLRTPWIAPPAPPRRPIQGCVVTGFTDEHFELKYGVLRLLRVRHWTASYTPLYPVGSRWQQEGELGVSGCDWVEAASALSAAQVFLGDCSALHVLAVALGVPVVLMEPNPHRGHDVFYPLGKSGPEVTLVMGTDGQPTFDARHVADAIEARLACGR